MAVLELKKDGQVVDAIVNAVVAGYKDDLIIEELANAVESETILKDQFEAATEALKLYSVRFTNSIQNVVNSMSQFEFNDKKTILKNRPMNLAQQVMQDVDGFKNASKEFYNDDNEELNDKESKEADIKKPQLLQPEVIRQKPKVEKKPEDKKDVI